MIWIFFLIKTRSPEINYTGFFIDIFYIPNHPFTFRYLPDNLSIVTKQIEMTPAVAFRNPKHLLPILQIITEAIVIIEESRNLFIYQMGNLSIRCIHFTYNIPLVATLIKFECKCPAITSPTGQIQIKLILIQRSF